MPKNRKASDLTLLGRIGAHSMHAKHDSRKTSEPGRKRFLSSFEEQVDPDGTLEPEERVRRAEHLKKAYFTRLALLSAEQRRKQ